MCKFTYFYLSPHKIACFFAPYSPIYAFREIHIEKTEAYPFGMPLFALSAAYLRSVYQPVAVP